MRICWWIRKLWEENGQKVICIVGGHKEQVYNFVNVDVLLPFLFTQYFNLFDMLYILVFHQSLIGNCMISHFDVCSILLLIEISFVYHISVLMVTFVL